MTKASLLLALAGFATAAEKPVTFARDVAPILQEKCQNCHRAGQMAPMSLVTYEETRPWAKSIRERVAARQMPPWHLDKTVGIQAFQNDLSLSDEQISTITKWVDQGAALGDRKDMPPPKQWPKDGGWQLSKQFGEPDLIIKSDPYTMPAKGQDAWFKPLTQIPLTEPRWVRAVEMRPASPAGRKITHHALAYLQQEEPGVQNQGLLMEWAVNKNYDIYRPNTGKLLVPGARIWWEMHYHAVGETITDHVELAVYLYPKDETPKYRTYLIPFPGTPGSAGFGELDIQPNSVARTEGYRTLAAPARLENFQPHMHLRGKSMLLEAILPDGTKRTLSSVDHFNFNWMTNYIYANDAAPVLPKGTVIHVVAVHDNTPNNPNNPDPNQWVGWGDRTVDEMAHAWVNVTYLSDEDYRQYVAKPTTQNKPTEPSHDSPPGVTPAFEGWFANPDGTFSLLFGYYNRNEKQELDIPVGPGNRIEPDGPDYGQPTHFLLKRQWGVFTLTVPRDFGAKKISWTLVADGRTTVIPASLDPLWELSPFQDATGNTPPFIGFQASGPFVQGTRGHSAAVTTALPRPLTLELWLADDAHVVPGMTPPKTPPVTVFWSKLRGPGTVTFSDARPAVEPAGVRGKATTTVTFSEPGEYVLRAQANDWSGEGGRGFQCCWSNAQVRVTVTF